MRRTISLRWREPRRICRRWLRSNRPAGWWLDVDAHAATIESLPSLPLEDKDILLIPARGGTVDVLGAVNNSNALIYDPNAAVDDYLAKAGGPTREADLKKSFIIRADGSVYSLQGRTRPFSSKFDSLHLMPGRRDRGTEPAAIPQPDPLHSRLVADLQPVRAGGGGRQGSEPMKDEAKEQAPAPREDTRTRPFDGPTALLRTATLLASRKRLILGTAFALTLAGLTVSLLLPNTYRRGREDHASSAESVQRNCASGSTEQRDGWGPGSCRGKIAPERSERAVRGHCKVEAGGGHADRKVWFDRAIPKPRRDRRAAAARLQYDRYLKQGRHHLHRGGGSAIRAWRPTWPTATWRR